MPEPTPFVESKSPFLSRTIIAAGLIATAALIKLFGFELDDATRDAATDAVFAGINVLLALFAIYGRITATKRIDGTPPNTALLGVFALCFTALHFGSTTKAPRHEGKQAIPFRCSPLWLRAFVVCLGLTLLFGGCSSLTPEQRGKWSATGGLLARKAMAVAFSSVLNAAQSKADAGVKADWLDSLATGLRAQGPGLVTSDDFRAVAAIWAPAQERWQTLAGQLGTIYTAANAAPPAVRVEALATGLQTAAAEARH